jgi:hypothetical protein
MCTMGTSAIAPIGLLNVKILQRPPRPVATTAPYLCALSELARGSYLVLSTSPLENDVALTGSSNKASMSCAGNLFYSLAAKSI